MLAEKFMLLIDLENAAFDNYPDELELKIRTVERGVLTGYVSQGCIGGRIIDSNGNVCGRFDIKDETDGR
tara:strand:+ start:1676 stop:1885 length:210 start_codon:yes stop_codon:yes gene_type:complete